MMPAPHGGRHAPFLWCGLPTAEISREALTRLDDILDDEEHQRIDRLRVVQSRRDAIAAHGLRRLLLAALTGRPAESFRFYTEVPRGKPLARDLPGIDISLTHCDGYAAAAAGRHGRIGIDAEPASRRIEPELVGPHSGGAPIVVWTFKEALAKAEGSGLAVDLGRLSVDARAPKLLAAPESFGDPADWTLERHCHAGFTIAIAFGPGAGARV
jgi:phosphopantetheinyl transferase